MKTRILLFIVFCQSLLATAQTTVTLQGACATCPNSSTPNVLGELAPCNGLSNVRDFSAFGYKYGNPAGSMISGFISNEGRVYVGWFSQEGFPASSSNEICINGWERLSSTTGLYSGSGSSMHTALPARNVLVDAPSQTFKAIQKITNGFFILSDQGKIYNWGRMFFNYGGGTVYIGGPASSTLNAQQDCSAHQKLREIPHPDGKLWKAMQVGDDVGYAADEDGNWWCWGGGVAAKVVMPSRSIPLPSVGSSWYAVSASTYTPVKMDRLRVQPRVPQSDDQQTIVVPRLAQRITGNGSEFLSYIGVDGNVYSYQYKYDQNKGFLSDTTLQITLPDTVKAVKIQRGYAGSYVTTINAPSWDYGTIDYVLGTDGNIYKFVDGLPPAVKVDLGTYKFQDFIVRDPWQFLAPNGTVGPINSALSRSDQLLYSLDLVVKGGAPFISATRAMLSGVPQARYTLYVWPTVDFKISKIWPCSDTDTGFTILKSADNNHSYAINTRLSDALEPYGSLGSTYNKSINISLGTLWFYYNNASNAYGPYKLINCQN